MGTKKGKMKGDKTDAKLTSFENEKSHTSVAKNKVLPLIKK